jgi:hypothetical protein
MQVLFDQGTPVPLRLHLTSHKVTTVFEKGWNRFKNGDLLRLAESEGFEVFVTTDLILKYQQILSARSLAIVVLSTTSWPIIQKQTGRVLDAIDTLVRGGYIEVRF